MAYDLTWESYSQFPVHAPVVVKNQDNRWVFYHSDLNEPIETPCQDLEKAMFWYYLTEVVEVAAEEVKSYMEKEQTPENVQDFVAVRVPVDELR